MTKHTNPGKNNGCDNDKDGGFDFNNVLNKYAVESRRIYFWNELDEADALAVVSQLHYLHGQSNEPIQLIINSPGGSVDAMYAILDEMKALQSDGVVISTIVSGSAYSAAAVLLSLGTKGYRYARPNASIMLHPMSYSMGHDYGDYQEKFAEFMKKANEKLNNTIMEALGLKGKKQYTKFLADFNRGLWLTPEDAIERGVIDEIYTAPLK